MSEPVSLCPDDCPNRGKPVARGICVFGQHIDPVEILVQFAVLTVLLIPASRRANSDNFTWQEGAGWFGVIAVASALVRLAPTDRLNAYKQLMGK
jgi:hypothetical protein